MSDLYCGQAHATARSVNEHALSGPQPRHMVQGIVGGEERHRKRRCFLEREMTRFERDQRARCDGKAAEAPWRHGQHFSSDGKIVDRFTNTHDAPGALAAENQRICGDGAESR
ncbi:MAG TPA: hypothetical protein VND93_05510 [Myxococcales bacterium]|nr:hypothetical protein [Myxococcales bacterium]